MEFGASLAYQRIDATVETTLRAAAEVLKGIERGQEEEEERARPSVRGHPIERKSITVTSCSLSSVTSGHQPRATIRTPNDSRKNRKLYFPRATIGPKSDCVKSDCQETPTVISNVSSVEPMVATPDSLFPSAIYIPARRGSKIQISSVPCAPSSVSSDESSAPQSAYRMHIEKLATEPLEDIKYLKCRGQKKSKPDSMFPKASYKPGTGKPKLALSPCSGSSRNTTSADYSCSSDSSSNAPSLVYQPMEFMSTDGRVKMLLQPLEAKDESSKKCAAKKSPMKEEEFPIVPKQLLSNPDMKTGRTKFSTKLSIGENTIDLSGIFNGTSLKKGDLAKIVINGQSYSI